MRKTKRKKHTKTITKIVLFSGILIGGGIGIVTIMNRNVPEKGEYEQMYAMLDQKKSSMNSKEEFIERNSKIYEGIEMSDLSITDITAKRKENGNAAVSYTTNMQTAAGNVEFTNNAVFSHDWTGYHLIWQDQLIFPELSATDKVQVTLEEAKRKYFRQKWSPAGWRGNCIFGRNCSGQNGEQGRYNKKTGRVSWNWSRRN